MKMVSIIIINYNTSKYTLRCIQAIINTSKRITDYEIIVVDNNSELEDYYYLKNNFPKKETIKLYRSIINTGFGGGNMYGLQFANADYFLFLNNDAFFKNDCLGILYDFMETNGDVGVATAQNYNEKNEHVISFDHNKGLRKMILGRSFLEKTNSDNFPKRKKEYQDPVTVNWVNGAFMFFRKKALETVGGFDTNIFLYFEEMDICWRLKKTGYKSVLVPQAKITHLIGASTEKSKKINQESMRSYLYVTKKNYSFFKYLLIRLYFCISFIFKPKKWFLLPIVFNGAKASESLKQQQQIQFLDI